HPDAEALSRQDGLSPLDHALNDGEDFELCLVVAPEDAERLLADPPSPALLRRIGEVTAASGLRLRSTAGDVTPIRPRGFDHLATGKFFATEDTEGTESRKN